jgi:hypothetical protein
LRFFGIKESARIEYGGQRYRKTRACIACLDSATLINEWKKPQILTMGFGKDPEKPNFFDML